MPVLEPFPYKELFLSGTEWSTQVFIEGLPDHLADTRERSERQPVGRSLCFTG